MFENNDILSYFSRHLIGISWYEGPMDSAGKFAAEPTFYGASGFLLQPHSDIEMWSLVTAGHVLEEFNKRMRKVGVGSRLHSWHDVWGPRATCHHRIPFDIFDAPSLCRFDRQEGFDVAVVALPDLIQRALSQTTTPFTRENWLHQSGLEFDFYAMLGLPNDEAVQIRENHGVEQSVTTSQNPVLLSVSPCELPSDVEPTARPQFIGRVDSRAEIDSIVGMSGGPIFGFIHDSKGLRYWPVAIQSRWFPDSRVVIGTDFAEMASEVEDLIDEFLEQVP